MLTGALGGASGALPFTAAAKAGVEPAPAQAPAPGKQAVCVCFCVIIFSTFFSLALTAQGYYQYQAAAQDPAQYYYQPAQPQQYPATQDQGWVTSE